MESHFESDLVTEISVSPVGDLLACAKYYSKGHWAYAVYVNVQSLCNNNKGCVWKTAESSTCLHMHESSSKRYILNKSLRVAVSLVNKLKTIKSVKDGFGCCCCYCHGWLGDSCQQHSSGVLREKNKAPMANFTLSVFLNMTLSVILLFFTPYGISNFSLKYWSVENADFFPLTSIYF